MSMQECPRPTCRAVDDAPIDTVIEPGEKDLGGFSVRRVLPADGHARVGPFIFFDHLGPSTFPAGTGMDVRPHPHIGLSTLTYLFTGTIVHRDSLGFVQPIQPGAVNWMTAGKGIVHSERTPDELRATGFDMHGLQSWIALPDGCEEVDPAFTHHPAGSLPTLRHAETSLTLIAGEAFGERSPVRTYSPLFYLHAEAPAGAEIPLPADQVERALYVVAGELEIAGERYREHRMIVLATGTAPSFVACRASRVMLQGGAPQASDRTVWWNFSSSSMPRLEAAKEAWRSGRFGRVPGETEFIPLPPG
jgi:redox-sensitive bicupin YhaK (pirin superfamily)